MEIRLMCLTGRSGKILEMTLGVTAERATPLALTHPATVVVPLGGTGPEHTGS